jgi:predicted DCC family thiol-disulfide oxidoreductase YuxK
MKHPHLILYDDTCSLCLRSVERITRWDRKKQFLFSPILGDTAKRVLKEDWIKFKNANTLILIENYPTSPRIWTKGRAVMRILWLLGGWRKLLGWLAFVPLGVDQVYAFIAKRRHRF